MSDKKREYFSGKSLEQAIMAAACEYELTPEEVAYRRIEKRHGFLRTPKKVLIAVDPASPRKEPSAEPAQEEAPTIKPPLVKPAEVKTPAVKPPAAKPAAQRNAPPPTQRDEARGEGAPEEGPREGARKDSRGAAGSHRGRGGRGDAGGRRSDDRSPKRGGPRGNSSAGRPAAKGPQRGAGPRRGGGGRPGFKTPVDPVAEEQAAHARRMMELEKAEAEAARRREREEAPAERDRDEERPRREAVDHEIPEGGHPADEAMAHLLAVTGLELEAEVSVDGNRVEVEITGPDAELLLESDGKALSAMEHLLPKLLRGLTEEKFFCRVDTLGFREKRQSELEDLARKLADEVRDTGDSRTLEPLNPAERRIVHMVLADDGDVETESKGGGYLKRLTIWPA